MSDLFDHIREVRARATGARRAVAARPSAKPAAHAVKKTETIGEKIEPPALSVSEITARIKHTLEANFADVWVEGEISNLSRPGSGHVYLSLKDDKAEIRAVIWRPVAAALKFKLEDGMKILASGAITVYPQRGSYQLKIARIRPTGIGELELAFRQLKEKLEKEGLFDPARKKNIPRIPERIGVVTSLTGAALRDILNVVNRRFPAVTVIVDPVPVQGDGAAERIAAAIENFNRRDDVEVLIVGRGGGSLEDLWAFNTEIVARAIYKSRLPVVSAVGHEVDFTIADMVADRRALTPTEAGEIVTPHRGDFKLRLAEFENRITRHLFDLLDTRRQALDELLERPVMKNPLELVAIRRRNVTDRTGRLRRATLAALELEKTVFRGLAARLEALSPLGVIARGYAILSDGSGRIVKSTNAVEIGDAILAQVADGRIAARVTDISKKDAT